MSTVSRVALAFASSLALQGCAWVTATPVAPNSTVEGIRIYDVKPLLVISGSQASVVIVPNYNRGYAIRFGAFLAKHDFNIEIGNGMLAKLQSNQDSTALAIALVQLVQKAVETGRTIASAFSAQAAGDGGRFQVFDIIFDERGEITGLRPLLIDAALLRTPTAVIPGTGLPQSGMGTSTPVQPAPAATVR